MSDLSCNHSHKTLPSGGLFLLCFTLAIAVAACADDDGARPGSTGGTGGTGGAAGAGGAGGAAIEKGCDPIADSYCGFPFPNDYWTVEDSSTVTGRRLDLPSEIIPETTGGVRSDTGAFNEADGFSPAIAAMTHMPGATTMGLPTPDTIDDSLEADAPIVMINADNGERVPYWVDLDEYVVQAKMRVDAMAGRPNFTIERDLAELEEERALMVRPAMRLDDATRYIVGVRGVMDSGGALLEPTDAFRALRDSTASGDAAIEARRPEFEEIFTALGTAGVERSSLQQAWAFTTASRENNTQWMLHIRDDAFANFPDGVTYTIEALTDNVDPSSTACRLEITFDMPLYMTDGEAGALLNFGDDGMPEQNGTFEYSAAMIVPLSAQGAPALLVENGHGQLGAKEQVLGFQEIGNALNLALFALDFKGFAFDDVATIVTVLASGDLSGFRAVPERMHQGFLNFLMAMRTLSVEADGGAMTVLNQALMNDCGGAAINGSQRYYFGGSQGGILGASLMALSLDVTRGVLAVPGQPYNVLLNRSVNFDEFASFFYSPYDWNALDAQLNLALIQGLWDRAEPSGYAPYIREGNTLPGTPAHDVFIQLSKSDHQVANVGGYIMARTIGGVVNLAPTIRDVWGIPNVMGEHEGSAMIEIDFGNPDAPITNIPPWDDMMGDPHGRASEVAPLGPMLLDFLTTGRVENECNGPCDADDLF